MSRERWEDTRLRLEAAKVRLQAARKTEEFLRAALEAAKAAGAKRTAERVRHAIGSVGAAIRHAERRETEAEMNHHGAWKRIGE